MRGFAWTTVTAVGFGWMVLAFSSQHRPESETPWEHGVIIIGPQDCPAIKTLPAGKAVPTLVRLLPADDRAEALLESLNGALPSTAFDLPCQLRPRLIAVRLPHVDIGVEALPSGRRPEDDRVEVLAGPGAPPRDHLKVDDRVLEVVGVLKPRFALFAQSYLVRLSGPARDLFPPGDPSVHHAVLLGRGREQLRNRRTLERELEDSFPLDKYAYVIPSDRLTRRAYYLYLAGQAILLVGGSGALIGLYRWLAGRVGPSWLAAPFQEIARRPGLVWGVHLVYFGLVMVGSLLIYVGRTTTPIGLGQMNL